MNPMFHPMWTFLPQAFVRHSERCVEMFENFERGVGMRDPSPSIRFMQEQVKALKLLMEVVGLGEGGGEYSYDHLPPQPPAYFEQVLEE